MGITPQQYRTNSPFPTQFRATVRRGRDREDLLMAIAAESRPVASARRGDLSDHHRFKVGEDVHYTSGPYGRADANAIYRVMQLLPAEGDDRQYRIKSAAEPHERVAKESQLTP
jgi:hypothetical protein